MDNILNNIGDELIIKITSKLNGTVDFSDFSDSVEGETAERILIRKFRINIDGIFWTEWKDLNQQKLSEKSYKTENYLLIEVKYIRSGIDETGVIEFNNISFNGINSDNDKTPIINSSIFKNIIRTDEEKNISSNLFKKLYFRGILPRYIKRGENNDFDEDKDFIDLFYSISKFFSLLFCFSKRFENFKNDLDIILEYVKQYGIYIDDSSISLDELQYLTSNLYDEIRKRGTKMIFSRKNENNQVDGEFIRLLRNKIDNELIYEKIPDERACWCLGVSSPMYKGTSQSKFLNKTNENSKDFIDLNNFLFTKIGNSEYLGKNYNDKKVVSFSSIDGKVGLGRTDSSQKIEKLIVVDSRIDYEITFQFMVKNNNSQQSKLFFAIEGFNSLREKLNDAFCIPNGDLISEIFFEKNIDELKQETWYLARGIIHSYSTVNNNEIKTNLGYGTDLYFNNLFVRYISPKIQLTNDSGFCELLIWDYKIRPLVRGSNLLPLKNGEINSFSLGFIGTKNIFHIYAKNNNNNKSKEEIEEIIEKYLLPFNNSNILTLISN